jgi:hypothetical protein
MSDEKNKAAYHIKLSRKYTEEERYAIAADVIEYIRQRSSEGKGPDGKKWSGKYSKGYSRSLDFKNAGKSRGLINQQLSGDMLTELSLLESDKGKIVIGYAEGSSQHGKAEGNIIGSYGKPTGNRSLARPFIKVTPNELAKKILKNYPLDDEEKRREMVESREEAINNLAGEVTFDEEMDD